VNRRIVDGSGRRWAVAAAAFAAVLAAPAGAQVEEFGVGGGVAVPISEVAEVRSPGPHALLYLGFRLGPTLQLRATASFAQLEGDVRDPAPSPPTPAERGDLRVAGLAATVVWSPDGNGSGPYGFGGLGLYSLRDTEQGTNPDALVSGLTLGVGTNVRVGGLGLFGQTGVEVPFTTFGTDTESAPPMYLPFSLGVRVPLRPGG
jgi:hypothetical protein